MDHTLTIGRIVHFSFVNARRERVERPAIVVRVWNEGPHGGTVQLQVFTDAENDGEAGVIWRTSVQHREDVPARGELSYYWYWPDEAPVAA
jgi:hypothetical protein